MSKDLREQIDEIGMDSAQPISSATIEAILDLPEIKEALKLADLLSKVDTELALISDEDLELANIKAINKWHEFYMENRDTMNLYQQEKEKTNIFRRAYAQAQLDANQKAIQLSTLQAGEKAKKEGNMADKKCEFNRKGFCYALVCYSNEKCKAKDKNGVPKYSIGRQYEQVNTR